MLSSLPSFLSAAFGSTNPPAFGQQNTSAFGSTPAFGNTGNVFGAATAAQPATSNVFGGGTSGFGQTSSGFQGSLDCRTRAVLLCGTKTFSKFFHGIRMAMIFSIFFTGISLQNAVRRYSFRLRSSSDLEALKFVDKLYLLDVTYVG